MVEVDEEALNISLEPQLLVDDIETIDGVMEHLYDLVGSLTCYGILDEYPNALAKVMNPT